MANLGKWLDQLKAPKQDAIRVACIGNSITDGHGIDLAPRNGYPAQLQRILGNGYNVKNFGVSARTMLNKGDYPYMNELAWRDALAFKPDIVIIKLGTNDSKPENWQYNADFRKDLEQMITTLSPSLGQPAKKGKKREKGLANVPAAPKIYLCTPIPAFKSTWNINDSVIVNGIIPIQKEVAAKYGLQIIDISAATECTQSPTCRTSFSSTRECGSATLPTRKNFQKCSLQSFSATRQQVTLQSSAAESQAGL